MIPRKRFKPDQLWHYLCPALSTPRCHIVTLPATRRRCASSTSLGAISRCLRRPYSSTTAQRSNDQSQQIQEQIYSDEGTEELPDYNEYSEEWDEDHLLGHKKRPRAPRNIESSPTGRLENLLAKKAEQSPNIINATQILRVLIRDRGIRPETRHYKALIQCHTDPRFGSPFIVQKLLAEMEQNGVPIDAGTLHAALKVCPIM